MQALLDAIATAPDLPADAGRLFHGRGGRFPGCEHLALDVYPPVVLLTSFQQLPDDALAAVGAALQARWPGVAWVYQCRAAGAAQTRCMAGEVPEPHVVTEAGTRYLVHLLRGQNHGLFLDMAAGRRWVREQVKPGAKVLNLFAYTCAFSVVALQAGAAEVTNVDMASGALAIGRSNHELNGVKAGARFLAHDIFNSWGKLTRGGPYDLVVCDPPSFQKGSFVATKDYARLARRLPALLAPGGHALLCLNAPELGVDFLRGTVAEHAPELQFIGRLENPETFADVSPERSLKALVFRAA
ncbi:class I SAM-dependent methyltransferase [Roseateles puraquae]|uniref:SAM-dependent methyltransferase n=1 Tax=Roseateles puraquae TaxID=431059 RepID=A0A254NCY5_9BURK|nr:class I SAM-dependent methyltransferase [Roseateles puraquae]MDG0853920.1 SAM-dependent methyltransferase [Roseateles puraquae]OWR04752.1 SAM-dependent methyltransferase [Roseateles puraquae]